jgi:hypothetical protein
MFCHKLIIASSGFESRPAKLTSEFGKSAIFEIRTVDLAGANFDPALQ